MTKQWDSSVVIPSKEFYGIKAIGYHANDPFRFYCSKILNGPDAGKAYCYKAHAGQEGLAYDGGTGNPGDAGGQYGWNVKIVYQEDSRAIVRIWNSLHTNPDGCTYTLVPVNKSFPAEGGSTTINVSVTGNGCGSPDIAPSESWITATVSSFSGTSGVINISVPPNVSGLEKKGIVAIGGQLFNLTQEGVGPNLTGEWVIAPTQTCKGTGPKQRCRIAGSLKVSNIGNQDIATPFFVDFYLENDLIARLILAKLKAGNSKNLNLKYSLPMGQSASGKLVKGKIDAGNNINETNEGNNEIVSHAIP